MSKDVIFVITSDILMRQDAVVQHYKTTALQLD
jgi:hypothetical protein